MTEEEDIDGLAAEYVLGSLDPAERKEVDARRQSDASLADAVVAWERRLAPLSDRAPGVAPPAHLLDSILMRISAQAAQAAEPAHIVPLRRAAGRRWALAIGAGALAACLLLAIGWLSTTRTGPPKQARMDCSRLYKDFWEKLDPGKYARISPEQLAGVSRMALRAYDACQAGDEQDAKSLFKRLQG